MHGVTALLDALLPVFHEVAQSEQRVVAHRDPVFRRPRFHGHQDDASVQLLLIDLDTSTRKIYIKSSRLYLVKIRTKHEHEGLAGA